MQNCVTMADTSMGMFFFVPNYSFFWGFVEGKGVKVIIIILASCTLNQQKIQLYQQIFHSQCETVCTL